MGDGDDDDQDANRSDDQGGFYALRVAGRTGWRLKDSPLSPDALRDHLRDAGEPVEEIVVIAPPLRRGDDPSDGFIPALVATERGWAFDAVVDGWRAPDETMTPFPGTPEPVERIEVVYHFPISFCMRLDLSAGAQSTSFLITNTCDPIPDIVPWLERILDGAFPRLFMDREGKYTELHVFPAEQGVRLVCALFEKDWANTLDVTLDRLTLVEGFYRPLVTLWESAALAEEWRRWDFDLAVSQNPPPESLRPYSVRSARIDAALAGG